MGGTGTAFPSSRTALFYNPAHLTRLRVTRAPVTMFGLSASLSSNFQEQLSFYNDRLEPAINEGINNLDEAEAQALYDDVFRIGSRPTVLGGSILFPSFVMNRGAFGFGGGVFANSEVVYSVEDAGAGVPGLDFTALLDVMAVAATGVDLGKVGLTGLSVGVTGKFSQRYVSLKLKPFDAIDDDESVYILGASTLAFDFGVLYGLNLKPLPGQLFLGATLADVTPGEFDYKFAAYYVKNEKERKEAAIEAERVVAQERYQLASTMRLGASYVLPSPGGPLGETIFSADYVLGADRAPEAPMLSQLSLGFQTALGKTLFLRTGLHEGYTSFGGGFQFAFARIDYAYYGSELGRLPGQSPAWHHHIQVSLGSF